ncbi:MULTISPECIES: peptidoglycan-binding protein LysM [unclassified Neisseria]|uniref:peptidoglycan-binding protein LysM n=1 Tax=unclassified Neisseria TaxID=2623750 RepID=UPI0026663A7E|nr:MULTISPECIES: peptidoglycan-binding protein LysM [unclassified Neisseria]MDO1510912.1 peptidoglycan-binding protein LysM [Neisseria sp. MVDL19-042950]MDO1516865.1 peptidoglycan-binding protein LysM [Neisseria sp. MVDL18-041461]MDO1563923.1 peptidoglycan-binding protein LysM [Neisseria sp. MVDL20-010259]
MRKNKPVEGIAYNSNREGFIFALARRESSADLNKDDAFNQDSMRVVNGHGYVGLFQYGTSALIDIGYKTKDGLWTGKNGAISLEAFKSSRQTQIAAINLSIDLWCKRLRATGLNEYYGKIVKGIEITESGCIAGCHLVGLGGLASFLNAPGSLKINKNTGKSHKEFDGNGVHISHYIDLFANYDLETCCKRKVRIKLKEPDDLPLEGKTVTILSSYSGKYPNNPFKVSYQTDQDGELPVIVRHPGAKIVLEIDGRQSEEIIQSADKTQPYSIIASYMKVSAPLAAKGAPEPKKQDTEEQPSSENISESEKTASEDINFNIAVLEGDTGKPISNVKFTLVYKGNPKQHITDGSGIKENIVAETGQKIQFCMAGEGNLQPVTSFTVSESLRDTTVNISLPVHTFHILVVDTEGKPVPNTGFSIFYRNKERIRKTDAEGRLKIKALLGFVYGFGNKGNPLLYQRCLQSVSVRKIIVNLTAVQIAQGSGQTAETTVARTAQQVIGVAKPTSPPKNGNRQSQPAEEQKTELPKPKQQEPVKQKNTHTEKGGKPLTVVGEENVSKDTVRYHIYYDGTIKRENEAATGFVEFIYYDIQENQHFLKRTKLFPAKKWVKKGVLEKPQKTIHLLDMRSVNEYKQGNVGYTLIFNTERYYINPIMMAAILGAMCVYSTDVLNAPGVFVSHGGSHKDGSPNPSSSHINGESCDFRYLAKPNTKRYLIPNSSGTILASQSEFDKVANEKWVEIFKLFGIQTFYTGTTATSKIPAVEGTRFWVNHHHHLHIGKHNGKIQKI